MGNPKKNLPAVAGEDDALVRAHELTLDELAIQANAEARKAEERALHHAFRAGMFLLEAKVRCEHGQWLPWLAANWHYSQQHASRFMQLAEAADGRAERVAVLEAKSVRGALAALGKPVQGHGPNQAPRSGEPNHSRVSNLPEAPEPASTPVDAEFSVRPDIVTTSAPAPSGPQGLATRVSAPPPALSGRAAFVVPQLDAIDRHASRMLTTDANDRAHGLVAQAIPLLVEAGIYRLELAALPKPIQVSEGVLWRFEEELDHVARKLARRWRENDPAERPGLVARAEADYAPRSALPASTSAIAALRRSPLNSDAIRDVVYEVAPPVRSWQGGLYEAEQHVVLLLRDAWAVLEARIARAPAGAASVQALRDLRAALTPLVTQAEAVAREACGPDRPDPQPKPPGRRKRKEGQGAADGDEGQDDAAAPAGEDA